MRTFLLLLFLFSSTLYAQPPIAQPNDLGACDQNNDGFETFDLTSTSSEILNGLDSSLFTVVFYTSESDAQNDVNFITNPETYTNSSTTQTIYVRVEENANPLNFGFTQFNLVMGEALEFWILSWLTSLCDGQQLQFYLNLSGTPNATVFFTMNGTTELSIDLDENGLFNQPVDFLVDTSIFFFTEIRSNTFPFCSKSLFDPQSNGSNTVVLPNPDLVPPPDLVAYESSSDGIATFDLTVNESIILNGMDPDALFYDVKYYYRSLENPVMNIEIEDPTAFENLVNNQTIYFYANTYQGCASFVTFDLIVLEDDIVLIPDANFKAKLLEASPFNQIALNATGESVAIDTNNDGEIQLSEAAQINSLAVSSSNIASLVGIKSFVNLVSLNCGANQIVDLDLEGMINLNQLNASLNQTETINLNDCPKLSLISLNGNNLSSFELNDVENLRGLYLTNNLLTTITLENVNTIDENSTYFIGNNPLEIVTISNSNLQSIRTYNSPIQEFNLINSAIRHIFLDDTNLQELNLSNNSALSGLRVVNNLNSNFELNISNCPQLLDVFAPTSNMTFLDISGSTNLRSLTVYQNSLSEITGLADCTDLIFLDCSSNAIASLDVSGLENLLDLSIAFNLLTEINVENNTLLETFYCSHNQFNYLDVSKNVALHELSCSNNEIEYLLLKNGQPFESINYYFHNNPLHYVCADDFNIADFESYMLENDISGHVNSYCTFTAGGDHNTITGNVRIDGDNNGCEETDLPSSFFRFLLDIDGVATNSSVFTNSSGIYNFYTSNPGVYSFRPSFENSSYFDINPETGSATIDEINNATSQIDFCITANGVHPDLEIIIAPIIPARPGFEAKYLLVYKNKGNQVMSQDYGVNFFYNQHLMEFVSSTVVPSSQGSGGIQWSFENLMPFESRRIEVTMVINTPTNTENPVNIDDELVFTSVILPQSGDENTQDNTFVLNQSVIGSFDPNDIVCLQGDVVSPSEIGNYLHYVIRFENTGNAPAENIVVKTAINPTQFDANSIQLLSASHQASIRLNDHQLEFIFQDIQLEAEGHGNILFKMRTNEALEIGDLVQKKANIYFDYNFPIETNEAETLFEALSVVNPVLDNLISIYPNPTKDIVTISIKDNSTIKTIELFDIQGRLLQTQLVNNSSSTIDFSARANGMYFVKIKTDKGSKVTKLIKE